MAPVFGSTAWTIAGTYTALGHAHKSSGSMERAASAYRAALDIAPSAAGAYAGLGSALWILILGGLIASLTGLPTMHFALAVGGAVIFSLYIVYDVWEISKRLSPDEYITAAISLYLDIVNLFLHILRILASLQSRD